MHGSNNNDPAGTWMQESEKRGKYDGDTRAVRETVVLEKGLDVDEYHQKLLSLASYPQHRPRGRFEEFCDELPPDNTVQFEEPIQKSAIAGGLLVQNTSEEQG